MSHKNEDARYEQIHDECYSYMVNELRDMYRPLFWNTSFQLDEDERYILLDWLADRAVKYADEKAPELFNERGQ